MRDIKETEVMSISVEIQLIGNNKKAAEENNDPVFIKRNKKATFV